MIAHGASVVHVTEANDRQAVETLGRIAQVIAAAGLDQVVLVLDGRGPWPMLTAVSAAEIRPLPDEGAFGRTRALRGELRRLSRGQSVYAVHLHGVAACLLGARVLSGGAPQGRVVYSPHLSSPGAPWAALRHRLMKSRLDPAAVATVTASLGEAHAVSKLVNRSAEVLPYCVARVFFDVPRQEAASANVLADATGAQGIEMLSRLSVLLNGREPRVPISWLGIAQADARAQLEAAGIRVLDPRSDAEKARALSRASAFLFVALEGTPLAAAQAMAAGVPCLLSDTLAHRALVRHGETGLICTSERDLLERLVLLLRDGAERKRIGEAARDDARRCFTPAQFERAVLRAYGLPANPASVLLVGAARQAAMSHAG
jgi:hypothetical protein